MAENTVGTATAPIDYDKLGAAIGGAIAAKLGEQLKPLADNQKVLADTMAAQAAGAAAGGGAGGAAGSAGGKKAETDATSGLTLQQVEQLLDKREQARTQAATRQALKDRIATEKLGGDKALAAFLPDTDDEGAMNRAAETLATKVAAKQPDVGGVTRDGGTTTAKAPVDYSKLNPAQRVQLGVEQTARQQTATA